MQSSFDQVTIGGFPSGGLTTDKKPFLLADQAYSKLNNAFVFRERTIKREGLVGMGRLQINVPSASFTTTGTSPFTFNILTTILVSEPNASIKLGSVVYTISTGPIVFTDNGMGQLVANVSPLLNFGTINYATGAVEITTTVGSGAATTLVFSYYPGLPVQGICKQDIITEGIDNTIFFDTMFAYQFTGGAFQELPSTSPTTWTGDQTQFFWYCNYQGTNPSVRYFFATNDNVGGDPIRYYNNSTWTALTPIIADNPPSAAQSLLYQGLIVIPYYGRLLVLNTWEGLTSGGAGGSSNFFARCRFSQIGDPTAVDAWRSDQFGKGGFLDAPTNESIVSAAFFRNVLIVFFEYSTWQLRYIGEYGLPFIFERISSDYGAISTFSSIVFDQGVMAVSDRGIIQASAGGLTRLDEQIPQLAFGFEIENSGPNFVHGVRNFEKEVVYWNYLDKSIAEDTQSFPNTTLLFNYRNNTWAQFRDTMTCFGTGQFQFGITWDSDTTIWNNENVLWDSSDDQEFVTYVLAGNQQGYVFVYEDQEARTNISSVTQYAASLFISAITSDGTTPTQFTSPNHNLANGEFVYLTGTLWTGTNPGINNQIYKVTIKDANIVTLSLWNGVGYTNVILSASPVYIGGGEFALLPIPILQGKDFNPYQNQGKQFKLSYIDFQMDSDNSSPSIPAITVQLYVNSNLTEQANMGGNLELLVNSALTSNYIQDATQDNPCLIESDNHSLTTGDQITIANVLGMTQLNNIIYTITVVDANHFKLNGIDSSGFTAYAGGGIWNSIPQDGDTYQQGSEYAWYRFYSTQYGQYLRIVLTYDDILMNQVATHQSAMELNGYNLWMRQGGRLIN